MSAPAVSARTVRRGAAVGGSRLYRDAASLASSSMLTAGFGFLFWGVAARTIPPERLGVQTALLSALTAPGLVVGAGVGDAFTSLLPAAGGRRPALVRDGYRLVVTLSGVLGVLSGALAITLLGAVHGSPLAAATVAFGTVIWALFTVQDSALTSLAKARWLPAENGSVSAGKILLLLGLAAAGLSGAVVLATLISAALAVAVLGPQVRRLAARPGFEVDTSGGFEVDTSGATQPLRRLASRTTTSVAMSLGALTLLPFVVTAIAGPAQGAVFALCLAVVQSLDFVAAALGVSLVVHASSRPAEAGRMARVVLLRAAVLVAGGGLALSAVSPVLLRLLRPDYVALGGVAIIVVLCAGSLGRTVFIIWAGLQRSRQRMRPVLVVNAVTVVVLYLAIVPLADRRGALGAAIALCTAQGVMTIGAVGHVGWCRWRMTGAAS